jgi:iron complex outermembrane receptor protein
MTYPMLRVRRGGLLAACALGVLALAETARAADAAGAPAVSGAEGSTGVEEIVVTATRTTRSAVQLGAVEIQKILPGVSPLKAIQTLPGVVFETADPWGNNEQNETLYVHGFSLQQLGFTFDGVPLGDQQYGNYNGLSPSRAITSENVSRVILSSGAGDLGTPSTSNLGGTIETYSIDPSHTRGGMIAETLGSYDTTRTFLRLETGDFGGGNSAYISYLHQDQRAWDFDGHQRGDQANLKYVHDDARGKLTLYADYSNKVEPNEDSIVHDAADPNPPYTRPFIYPNIQGCLTDLLPSGAPKAPPGSPNNFSNCFSAAQRQDDLAYAKYDFKVAPGAVWSTQAYYHYDYGRGIVAGAVDQAGLPGLFNTYYPGQNLDQVFGGSGYAVRTTEYLISRGGVISNVDWTLGSHEIQGGLWYEHNHSTATRVWYPFSASSTDLSPYDTPTNYNFIQYKSVIDNNVVQLHLQDQWRIRPDLLMQAGFKSSLQFADGYFPINQENLPSVVGTNSYVHYPSGEIDTRKWFLPQVGAVWDATAHEQVFANIQNNLRQFITYGASGPSPWSLATQTAFDLFKSTVKPETSWTYEVGLRTHREFDLGLFTGFEGQVNYYHVDFSNRLLQISPTPVILSLVSGPSILANVGSVTTNGVDVAATLHFGSHFAFYDAFSYMKSVYQDDYTTGTTVVPTAGKEVPGDPSWMNKFVASVTFGDFEGQVIGDYVGQRYATYTNDLFVPGYFLTSLEVSYKLPVPANPYVEGARLSLNVTNLGDIKGASTLVVGAASGTYNTYPIPPRQFFVTLSAKF